MIRVGLFGYDVACIVFVFTSAWTYYGTARPRRVVPIFTAFDRAAVLECTDQTGAFHCAQRAIFCSLTSASRWLGTEALAAICQRGAATV